jgi:hypothetical protein
MDMILKVFKSKQIYVTTFSLLISFCFFLYFFIAPNSNAIPPTAKPSSSEKSSLVDKTTIFMVPKNPIMTVNGIPMEIDPPGRGTTPVIEKGRTLIPISALVNILGGDTYWDSKKKGITVQLNNNTIELTINSLNILVNGFPKKIETAPKIVNQRTLVPIRFIVENCGISIEWKDKKVIMVADYLPEGIQRTKNLFNSTQEIENFSKLPSLINTLTRVY